jgi:hypothetical protein
VGKVFTMAGHGSFARVEAGRMPFTPSFMSYVTIYSAGYGIGCKRLLGGLLQMNRLVPALD